ncbi:Maf family protein [Subtercola sp. PAMC28395]|uniref:Maf family protein n=1 Tax=Subtercola sp. PAMC28395 TaxID=2846775 RepID=UPI001C0AC4A7|nr:Maf family protein [Subtercola sp. PAMC28395]QWT25009.1 Maf family protein [Subtercola sp. PAMC28395]
MRLYLASTSPARLTLLRQAGIEPVVVPSNVDEDAAVAAVEAESGPLSAGALVILLARLKAEAVQDALPEGEPIDGFILGGDSAFEFDGVIYGKPHLPHVARERWLRHRGRSGVLHSGHWMIDHRLPQATPAAAFPAAGAVTSATVEFASDITEAEIDAYVATGEPLTVAGAFTIDGLAAPFITHISGAPSTVIGMSLPTLRDLLAELGVSWTDFWATA